MKYNNYEKNILGQQVSPPSKAPPVTSNEETNIKQNINYAYLRKKIIQDSSNSNFYQSLIKQNHQKSSKDFLFKNLVTLRGHLDSVQSLLFKENLLLSAGTDRSIKIWDLKQICSDGGHE